MSDYTIEVDLSGAASILNAAPRLLAVVDRALYRAGSVAEREVKRLLPVDAGTLRASVKTELRPSGSQRVAEVGTAVHYAEWVEEGRAPGKRPPVQALIPWVKRNLRIERVSKRTKRPLKRRRGPTESEARSLAYVIARKIGREGTKGRYPFREGLKAATPEIMAILQGIEREFIKESGG